jgi:hypothetical protein
MTVIIFDPVNFTLTTEGVAANAVDATAKNPIATIAPPLAMDKSFFDMFL